MPPHSKPLGYWIFSDNLLSVALTNIRLRLSAQDNEMTSVIKCRSNSVAFSMFVRVRYLCRA